MASVEEIFVENLKSLMQHKTADVLTQEEIAKICGVSQNTVSSWLTGRTMPKIATLKHLADHYRLTVDWFITEPAATYKAPNLSFATYEDCYKTLIYVDHTLLGDSALKVTDPIVSYLVSEYLRLIKQTKNGDLSQAAVNDWQMRVHDRFSYRYVPLEKRTLTNIKKKVAVADQFETCARMVKYINDNANNLEKE